MKKKSAVFQFNGLFLFSYAAGAIGTTQMIPYLVEMGFEGTRKGIILSAMAISTLISQFLFGYLSDKFKGCRWFFLISFFVFFAADVTLFNFHCPDMAGAGRYVGAADRSDQAAIQPDSCLGSAGMGYRQLGGRFAAELV